MEREPEEHGDAKYSKECIKALANLRCLLFLLLFCVLYIYCSLFLSGCRNSFFEDTKMMSEIIIITTDAMKE